VLDSYITQIDRASGRLQASLRLNGTLRAPQFDGDLTVSDAQVDAYQINLALRDINFAARLSDNRLSFDGRATAGVDGKAQFDGELAWRQGLPYGKLHLQGTDLRVINIPEARVQVSPDVNLTVNGRRIDITGTIELPYARLEQPDQLANAVRVSGDEVIVSAEQSAPDDPFRVYSNVTLKLGDRVTISTSGLSGRLRAPLPRATTNPDSAGAAVN
jgi:translocation and assembly module TamB